MHCIRKSICDSPLSGIVKCFWQTNKNVSDKQIMSMLFTLINILNKGTLTKSWATIRDFNFTIEMRFQWQKFSLEDFIGPGLISMLPDCNNSKWCKIKEYIIRMHWIKSNSFSNFK